MRKSVLTIVLTATAIALSTPAAANAATTPSRTRNMNAPYGGRNNLVAGTPRCQSTFFRQIERDAYNDPNFGRGLLTLRYCTELLGTGAVSSGQFSIRMRNGDRLRGSYSSTIPDITATQYTGTLAITGGTGRWRNAGGTLQQNATILSVVANPPGLTWQVTGTIVGSLQRVAG
jgi:hypothetical protein